MNIKRHTSDPTAARNNGFSIIETLIVISLMTLLLALILPAFSAARSTALGFKCRSNLRQIGVLSQAYTIDRRGYTMPSNVSTSADYVSWQNMLNVEYTRGAALVFICPSIPTVTGNKTGNYQPARDNLNPPFDNPRYGELTTVSYTMNVIPANGLTGFHTTSSMNGRPWGGATQLGALGYDSTKIRGFTGFTAPSGALGADAKNFPIKTSRLKSPSGSIYITDHRPDYFAGITNNAGNMTTAFVDGTYQFMSTDWGTNLTSTGTPRVKVGLLVHAGFYNALYGDGNVKAIDGTRKSNPEEWIAAVDN